MKSNSLSYSSPGRRSLQFSNDHDPNPQISRAHRRSMSPNYMSPTVSALGVEFSEDYFLGCSVCGTKAIETSIEGSFHESPPKIRPSNKFETAENCTENSNSYSKLVKVVKRNSFGDKNEVTEIKKKIIETNSKPEEWDSDIDRSFKIIEEDPANEDGVVINEIHYKEVYPAPKTELTALNYREAKSVQESFYYNPAAIENVKEEERKRVVIRRAEYSNRTKGICKSMVATINNADDIKNDNIKEKINKERQKLEELNRERQRLEELQEKKSDLITPKKLKSSSYSVERSTGGRKENDSYITVRENARKTTPSRAELSRKNGATTPKNEIRTPRSQTNLDEIKADPFEYKRSENKSGAEITTPRSQTGIKNDQQQDSRKLDDSRGQILDDSKSDIKTPKSQLSNKEDAKNDSFTLNRTGEKTKSIKQSIIEQMSNKDKKSNKDLSFSSKKSVCSAQEYQHTRSDIGEDDLNSLKSMPIYQGKEEAYEIKNPEIVVDNTINIFKNEENIEKPLNSQEKKEEIVDQDSPKFSVEDPKCEENEQKSIEAFVEEEEIVEIEQSQSISKKPEKVKVRGGKSAGLPGRAYEPVLGNRRTPETPENSEGVIRVKGNLVGSSKGDSDLTKEESKLLENSPYGNSLSIITSPIKDDSIVCEDQIVLTEQSPTKLESNENPSDLATNSPTKMLLENNKSKQDASPAKSSGSKHSSPAKSPASSKPSTPVENSPQVKSPNSSPSVKLSPLSQSPMPEDLEEPIKDENFDNKSQTSAKSQNSSKSKNDDAKSQTSSKSKNEDSKSQNSSNSKNEESKSPKKYENQSPISKNSENYEIKYQNSQGSSEILIEENQDAELQQRGTGEFPENEQAYPFKEALAENYSQETQEMLHFKPLNIDQRQYRHPSFGENQEDFVDTSSINVERASSPALSLESGGKKSKIHYNTFDSIREEHVQYENEYESSIDEYSGQNPNDKSTQTRNSSGGNIEITEVRIHQMLALLCDDKILKGLRMIGGFAQYFEEHGHEFLNR